MGESFDLSVVTEFAASIVLGVVARTATGSHYHSEPAHRKMKASVSVAILHVLAALQIAASPRPKSCLSATVRNRKEGGRERGNSFCVRTL